jgi:DNA-binding transcriptional ArsR family regulator
MLMKKEMPVPVVASGAETVRLPLRAKFFRGLADPSRLFILDALRTEPLTVGAVAERTGLSQPNTSNHLACLLECGLVDRERHGKCMVYSLADARVAELLVLADALLANHHEQLAACTRYTVGGTRS